MKQTNKILIILIGLIIITFLVFKIFEEPTVREGTTFRSNYPNNNIIYSR